MTTAKFAIEDITVLGTRVFQAYEAVQSLIELLDEDFRNFSIGFATYRVSRRLLEEERDHVLVAYKGLGMALDARGYIWDL